MRNVSDKSCRENQNTHIWCSVILFLNRAVYETMWKNIVELGKTQATIWLIRFAFWLPMSTNTHSQVFPLQQWLHERFSLLRYTYSISPALFFVTTDCPEADSSIAVVGKICLDLGRLD
jgi:hypothetical protein